MKFSKKDLALQKKVDEVLLKDNLTFEDKEFIYQDFNPGSISDVTTHSAYFTPLDLAYDFALFAGRYGTCVDMCAGIGILSFCARIRDTQEKNISNQICIERNPDYIKIGKTLLPEAIWIEGDIFDKAIWDGIIAKYGKIDSIVSNPPFGKVTKTGADRSWLKYKGADLDIAAIEVALKNSTDVSMLLPKSSVSFRYSGRPYFEEVECKKIIKLKEDTGMKFTMTNPGIDTSVYDDFKNTKYHVEHVDFVDVEL